MSKSSENKSNIKFDMTMSKSQGKEIENISQEYKDDFEEYSGEKANKTYSENFIHNE